jgi:hypothetical protein
MENMGSLRRQRVFMILHFICWTGGQNGGKHRLM